MSKGTKTPHVVIAATKDDTAFKAVALRRQDGSVELLWSRRMPVDGGTWEDFAAECGLAADSGPGARVAAIGLDSAAVAFYQIRVPHVGKEETAAIVRMQAESLLPLPEDQIEVAWRSTPSSNGTVDVTMAAARRDHLCRFVESVRALNPQTIVPACEGAARAWRELFSGRGRRALLLSLGPRNTQLSLVADGLVAAAAALDTGTNDLVTAQDGAVSSESAGAMERFVHDVQVALDSFAGEDLGSCPMFVLSDGDEAIDRIIAGLNAAGMNAQVSLPEAQALRVPPEFGTADIYAYRTPIGLALMRLDAPAAGLNLLERIHATQEQQKAKSAWYSTALAGAVAAVMLVVLVVVAYLTDVASEKRLTALVSQGTFEEARQRQALLKTVARHRPDMLGLLTELSAGDNSGIVLDDFQFKKGQLVAITGRADNTEKMWQYQASLRGQKNIKEVEISNAAQDTKAKKIRFTMVFHYKNFTKKGASL